MPLTESVNLVLRNTSQPLDADAQAYVNAVEVADGQRIEDPVRFAINNFVIGCKADGIWSAIKASCILAGARTLSGALVPLVGTAPTNVGNAFVQADYNRKTGLVGNGSTKYLNANRAGNADPANNAHLSVYVSTAETTTGKAYIGSSNTSSGSSNIGKNAAGGNPDIFFRNQSSGFVLVLGNPTGLLASTRNSSASFSYRVNGATTSSSMVSQAPDSTSFAVFGLGGGSALTDARLAFYSIGQSLDLALLDARVTALITAIGAAIP